MLASNRQPGREIATATARCHRAMRRLLTALMILCLAAPATDGARDDRPVTQSAAARETQLAAAIALGRLGDERGREVLERLANVPDPFLRGAAVWALGRTPGGSTRAVLERALRDAHAAGVPLLGVCFGGQLLAHARGGSVRRSPAPEIG